MKKLLLFLLLSFTIPTIGMQLQKRLAVQPDQPNQQGLLIHPTVYRFKGNDAPTDNNLFGLVYSPQPQIYDYIGLPRSIGHVEAQAIDSNGRNLIWWAALMGKKNLYNGLLEIGANPTIKSTKGLLAGLSAEQLIEMDHDEIEALIDNAIGAKAKL